MKKTTRSLEYFKDWTSYDVERELGYLMQKKSTELQDWLTVEGEIDPKWTFLLEALQDKLLVFHNAWNETELMADFISPFLFTVDFHGKNFNHFSERPLKAKIGKYTVKGYVDWVVASGGFEPETPYFFFHEYKKMKGTDADPLGQLLIEMIAAQTLNETPEKPLYGCYVIGRIWIFVLLKGKTYAVSEAFDVLSSEELKRIWLILNKTKGMIAEMALENEP